MKNKKIQNKLQELEAQMIMYENMDLYGGLTPKQEQDYINTCNYYRNLKKMYESCEGVQVW